MSLPFYLITHRCGDGVYTYEARTDKPLTWLELVNLVWSGEITDIVSVTKVTPPADCYNPGRTDDAMDGLVNSLSYMSDKLREEPCEAVKDFLTENEGSWYVEETEQGAWARHYFSKGEAA